MQHSFSRTYAVSRRMVRWYAYEQSVVQRAPGGMAWHRVPVLLCLLLVVGLRSVSAAEAPVPLVPLTSRFAHWDHHWFVWLPRHPVYEAVEIASRDTPEHPVPLVWVFFTERAGVKRQVHYLNNPDVAAHWTGSVYREMQYARRGAVGQPQGVTVHLQDQDHQPVDMDITVDTGPLRPAGLTNQSGHAATSHFLVFFREQRAVAVQNRVVMAGEDFSYNTDEGVTERHDAKAVYSTNVYTVVLPFLTTRVRYTQDPRARASDGLFVPTRTTAAEVVYTRRAGGVSDVVQLGMTSQGGLQTYTHQAGPYRFTIRFTPPLVWEPAASPEPVTYSMSLDQFADLVRGQVQPQREGQHLRLTWRHASPLWAQASAFESILTRDAGEEYQLTVSPLR